MIPVSMTRCFRFFFARARAPNMKHDYVMFFSTLFSAGSSEPSPRLEAEITEFRIKLNGLKLKLNCFGAVF